MHCFLAHVARAQHTYICWRWAVLPFADQTFRFSFRRFLAQHSVAMLGQCCKDPKQCRNNAATMCCARFYDTPCKEILIPESGIILFVQFGIFGFVIGNSDQGIRNPSNYWILNSSSNHKEYWNPSFKDKGIRNPKPGIWNPKRLLTDSRGMTWLLLSFRAVACTNRSLRIFSSFCWITNYPSQFYVLVKALRKLFLFSVLRERYLQTLSNKNIVAQKVARTTRLRARASFRHHSPMGK